MKKAVRLLALALLLMPCASAMAQDREVLDGESTFPRRVNPLLQEGVKELGLSGNIDLEGPAGGVDADISASYGYFIRDLLEVGGFANYSRVLDGDVQSYALGAFLEQHFPLYPELVAYAGLNGGIQFTEVDFDDDEASLFATGRLGVKWFLRDYVAVDTNIFLKLAADEIYVNDRELDYHDVGINIGLRVYFR